MWHRQDVYASTDCHTNNFAIHRSISSTDTIADERSNSRPHSVTNEPTNNAANERPLTQPTNTTANHKPNVWTNYFTNS